MLGSLLGGFGLSNPVNPEKFLALWPTFLSASSKVAFPEGRKPKKMFEIPSVQGVVACRDQMNALGISPTEAAAYGTRLSLTKGILDEKELAEALQPFVVERSAEARDLKPELVMACAVSPLKSTLNGPAFDTADLLTRADLYAKPAAASEV